MELASKYRWCLQPALLDRDMHRFDSIQVCAEGSGEDASTAVQELDLSCWTVVLAGTKQHTCARAGLELFQPFIRCGFVRVLLSRDTGYDCDVSGMEIMEEI